MANLQSKIINFLTNGQGFIMESYFSDTRQSPNFLAIKNFPQGNFAILITDDRNNYSDTEEAIRYLNNKRIPFNFQKIILSEGNYDYSNDKYQRVVVDINKNLILYCDEGCKPLENIIRSVFPRERSGLRGFSGFGGKRAILTYSLIGINIFLYLISAIKAGNLVDIDVWTLYEMGGKIGFAVDAGQYWRLFTCMFLHGSLMHLVFNMYALYILGPQIEVIYGRIQFSIIYLLSGLASSGLSYMLGDYNTISIGASGAIFGLLGAMVVFVLKNKNTVRRGAINNIFFIIILNLFIGFGSRNIDNLGHIGGLLFGTLVSFILVNNNTYKGV